MSGAFDGAFDGAYDTAEDAPPLAGGSTPHMVPQPTVVAPTHDDLHLLFAAPGTVSHRICGKRVEHHGKHPGWISVPLPGVEGVYLNKES